MMLRMLLVLVAVCGLALGGCKKKEPTPSEMMDQAKQDAEKAADETQKAADDMADNAEGAIE